ncbi:MULTISPECIES: hypothetical protein [Paraburkholderia]|uniref:Uncharacterized protein n=1 Tax=Paraburkholderia madseniana TaxID=2599607 RepID=A0AAP5B8C7_9BURK|nr:MULTISPECIES: hypothetical protein [Paraburkholderia]MCX4144786.1 hypothetical protein [Paraburkholderia madseniana]MDN7147738.1 hypothetical protein [Paraburkholderia sp. WS6]MDQ6406618.1 hypothetical protein [Paraburkholderia madseniana]
MMAFYALVLIALVVLASFVRSLVIIFSQSTERAARVGRIAGLWVTRIASVAVLWIAVNYWIGADLRSKAHDCRKTPSDGGRYIAELCLLRWNPGNDSDYVGRVYDAKNSELLAERTFSTPVPELSWWKEDNVSFSRGGDDSSWVILPPSLYDRLLAKLP